MNLFGTMTMTMTIWVCNFFSSFRFNFFNMGMFMFRGNYFHESHYLFHFEWDIYIYHSSVLSVSQLTTILIYLLIQVSNYHINCRFYKYLILFLMHNHILDLCDLCTKCLNTNATRILNLCRAYPEALCLYL